MDLKRNLLWVDCSAGALAGIIVLLLAGWLADWYQLPLKLIYVIGLANCLYACYSFSLAIRARRPAVLITVLVLANLAWAVLCLVFAFNYSDTASIFGLLHLTIEAVLVGGLAGLEWRWRAFLLEA